MSNKHILLVEDEVAMCELLAFIVESLGYNVKYFTYPPEALEYYKENHKDIILLMTDLSMYGLTGVELINEVLIINPNEGIVVVTGFFKSQVEHLIETDNCIIVQKPLKKPYLKKAIEKVISKKQS